MTLFKRAQNTSANPLVSPPQRMRLDDQPDIVFQDAPSSPTRLTIDHIAGMIRDQNREQNAREQRSGAEIRERIEEMERRMMNVLDSSHGGDGSGEHVGDAGDSDPETNVDLERSGLDADPGDTPADGMVTSPSPRRRRRSTEGSMTTNTSANPLVSPPQRIRLDDQSDIVFQDAPSSPPG